MIFIVTTRSHNYTHRAIELECRNVRRISYPALFARRRLPIGTYIFSDFDRLGFWQLELAAHAYRTLHSAGCAVLNDPARARQRLDLLRALHRAGINTFKAWPASEADLVDEFPVFVRTASAHRGNLTDLLENPDRLSLAIERLTGQGFPRSDLIVVEYRAEPIEADIFRKMSVYRLGEALVPATSVHERNWTAKMGEDGIAGEVGYARDLAHMRDNPHRDILDQAFRIAEIDYGRADFGIVAGRVEIYEINTNPMMHSVQTHRFPDRSEAIRLGHLGYIHALQELDDRSAAGFVTMIWPAKPAPPRRLLRLLPGYQWLP